MRSPRSQRSRSISFKITAMIDMAFLLITFFVMSIRFSQKDEEQITLPHADQASEVTGQRIQLITVNVTKDGRYLVAGGEQSGGQLFRYLQARKTEGEHIQIVIRGDEKSEFHDVQRVMRLGIEAGITDVSLAALQIPEEEN